MKRILLCLLAATAVVSNVPAADYPGAASVPVQQNQPATAPPSEGDLGLCWIHENDIDEIEFEIEGCEYVYGGIDSARFVGGLSDRLFAEALWQQENQAIEDAISAAYNRYLNSVNLGHPSSIQQQHYDYWQMLVSERPAKQRANDMDYKKAVEAYLCITVKAVNKPAQENCPPTLYKDFGPGCP